MKDVKVRGRRNRRKLKIQPCLYGVEIDVYEANGSDPLFIRFAVRKASNLCTHNALTEKDGVPVCFFCGEENPENFGIFTKKKEDEEDSLGTDFYSLRKK